MVGPRGVSESGGGGGGVANLRMHSMAMTSIIASKYSTHVLMAYLGLIRVYGIHKMYRTSSVIREKFSACYT